ncbi:hypothetical protein Lal_00025905 [Lupinus albus]|nr:hypothetical protein Lal_00025905 [Lupinus albus]
MDLQHHFLPNGNIEGHYDNFATLVWLDIKDGDPKVKCKRCGHLYMSREGGGTSNMIRHMRVCGTEMEEVLSYPPLDQGQFREKISSAIIKHCLSFSFVELEGIRDLHQFLNPHIKTISRNTAKSNILKIYKREKENLKCYFERASPKREAQYLLPGFPGILAWARYGSPRRWREVWTLQDSRLSESVRSEF